MFDWGLLDDEIYELVALRRTFERRAAAGQTLSSGEGDRAVRIALYNANLIGS